MSILGNIAGGLVRPVVDAGTRVVEEKQATRRTEITADAVIEHAVIENAQAINAGRSTWRPRWMQAIRRLLSAYFVISFVGMSTIFLGIVSLFLEQVQYSQWMAVKDDLIWFLGVWATLGGSLITVATWSFLGYSPFRSLQDIARNGDEKSVLTKVVKRVLPGSSEPPPAEITREEITVPDGPIERMDGIVVPSRKAKAEPLDVNALARELMQDEGVVYHIYLDTKGNKTAGIGHLLTPVDPEFTMPVDTKIPKARVEAWFRADIQTCIADARAVMPSFDTLPHDARLVLCNMAFQLGRERLAGFRKTLGYIEAGQWAEAAREALDSKWYREDTPGRAKRMAKRLAALA